MLSKVLVTLMMNSVCHSFLQFHLIENLKTLTTINLYIEKGDATAHCHYETAVTSRVEQTAHSPNFVLSSAYVLASSTATLMSTSAIDWRLFSISYSVSFRHRYKIQYYRIWLTILANDPMWSLQLCLFSLSIYYISFTQHQHKQLAVCNRSSIWC